MVSPRRGVRTLRVRWTILVELLHRAQHVDQQPLLIRVHRRRRLDLGQRLLDQLPALIAAKHFLADRFHHVLRHHAANHRQLGALRRIVQQREHRLLAVAEERLPGCVAEPLGNQDGNRRAALLDGLARFVGRRLGELQVLVALGARDDGLRDAAAVLIHDRHRDPCRLAVLSAAREHGSEKRGDRDRDDEAHDDRSTVAEKQLQVLADHGEEGNDSHQSRKLLPVSVRNTDSSVALPPPTTATRDCRPSSVSSAITLPWSMTTMRSASRSTSSM